MVMLVYSNNHGNPKMPESVQVGEYIHTPPEIVTSVKADCDELYACLLLMGRLSNPPWISNPSCDSAATSNREVIWYGDDAKFIVGNWC